MQRAAVWDGSYTGVAGKSGAANAYTSTAANESEGQKGAAAECVGATMLSGCNQPMCLLQLCS